MILLYIMDTMSFKLHLSTAFVTVALVALLLQPNAIRISAPAGAFAAFVAWAWLCAAVSPYREVSVEQAWELTKLWLIFFAIDRSVRTRQQAYFLAFFFLASFAVFPLRGSLVNYFVYHATTFGRVAWSNTFSNPNDLAVMCLLPLALAAGIWARRTWRSPLWWASAATILLLPLTILLTQSRGAFLGLAVFLLLSVGWRVFRPRAILALSFSAGVLLSLAPDSVWDRIGGLRNVAGSDLTAVDSEGSARQRFEIAKVAVTIIGEHPITGVGPGGYNSAHLEYAVRPMFDPIATGARDTHNTFLNLMAEEGFPGFALWCLFVGLVLVEATRARRAVQAISAADAEDIRFVRAAFFAILFAGLFGTYGRMNMFYVASVLLLAMARVYRFPLVGTTSAQPDAVPKRPSLGVLRAPQRRGGPAPQMTRAVPMGHPPSTPGIRDRS
jgi:O-antigen ligase